MPNKLVTLKLESLLDLEPIKNFIHQQLGGTVSVEDIFSSKFFTLSQSDRNKVLKLVSDVKAAIREEVQDALEKLYGDDSVLVLICHEMPVMMATSYLEKLKLKFNYLCHETHLDNYLQLPYVRPDSTIISLNDRPETTGAEILKNTYTESVQPEEKVEPAIAVEDVKITGAEVKPDEAPAVKKRAYKKKKEAEKL